MKHTKPSPLFEIESVEPETIPQLVRLPVVLKVTGLSRSTIYRMVAEHTFPPPVQIGKRAVAWRLDGVGRWALGRPHVSR
jgi:prophage regulatory protein